MDYEKIALVANSIDNTIRENTALKSIIVETSSAMLGDQTDETRQSIQEFLDAPLGDKKEMIMKKAVAAAMVVAKDRGILPNLPDNGSAIAAVVDDTLTRAKVAYQVGTGILDVEDAIDTIIDHNEARAVAFVDKVFDSGMVNETVTNVLVKASYAIPEIGPVVGPIAEHCKPIIKSFVAKAEPYAREIIKEGINVVANTVKSIARTVVETAKSTMKNIAKNILSIA